MSPWSAPAASGPTRVAPPGFLGSGPRLWGGRRLPRLAVGADSRDMTSPLNLATLLADSAARHPSRPALVAGDTTVDFATLDAYARTFAGDLSAPDGCHNFVTLMAGAAPLAAPHPTVADDTAVVLYTSGTTGKPKGAELTHANLVSNARAAAGLVDLDEGTVALVALPLFHAFGMTVMHNAVLSVGGSLVLVPRFNAPGVLQLLQRHRVTFLGGVPTMFMALLDAAPADCHLDSLQWCVSGGA